MDIYAQVFTNTCNMYKDPGLKNSLDVSKELYYLGAYLGSPCELVGGGDSWRTSVSLVDNRFLAASVSQKVIFSCSCMYVFHAQA